MAKIEHVRVTTKRLDARALLELLGQIDAAIAADASAIVLDLSEVEYVDSLGISALVDIKRRCHPRVVVLAGLSGFVATVARATHLAEIFDLFPSFGTAIRALDRASVA